MVSLSDMTLASVTSQMNMPWVSRSTYCSTFKDMKALIYLGRNTRPLSERSTSIPSNLFTVLPDLKPKDSNTEKGASTDRQFTFIFPVCLIT